MHWWERKVLGLETHSLNGISLIQPRGKANGICWSLLLQMAAEKKKERQGPKFCLRIPRTNIARSNALNILYSKYLMAIHKLHNSVHRSINFQFVCIFICNEFSVSTGYEREAWMCYVFYIDWVGLFNSIAAYPYLEGQWKSFENQWAEASKTKIIDCFQTPAGSRITNQNSSQGCLKLVLQILQPHI